MKTRHTEQTAYAGKFALETTDGTLVHGGGVDAPRPRLYDTMQSAAEAATSIDWVRCHPVLLAVAAEVRFGGGLGPVTCRRTYYYDSRERADAADISHDIGEAGRIA